MSKVLTEKQLHNRLDKYYKDVFGEKDTDAWYVNPATNVWRFDRDDKTIILTCHIITGKITEKIID